MISIKEYELKNYCNNYKKGLCEELRKSSEKLKDKFIYDKLRDLVEICEKKQLKADAIRMYINKHISAITERMNGKFSTANYTKESLGILMEIKNEREK